MPLNSPKRPPYWNSTSGFDFDQSSQSTCHSAPVSEILSKSDQPRQKKMTSYRFYGSLKSPCATSYRSSIDTVTLNCLVFEKIAFFAFWHFGILATDRQTDEQMDTTEALSRSRYRERRLNKSLQTVDYRLQKHEQQQNDRSRWRALRSSAD